MRPVSPLTAFAVAALGIAIFSSMDAVMKGLVIALGTYNALTWRMLAGTVVIENVFQLPGLGRLVFQAIANRDVPVVRDAVVILAAKVVFINFVVDLLYAWIDPRLKAHDV